MLVIGLWIKLWKSYDYFTNLLCQIQTRNSVLEVQHRNKSMESTNLTSRLNNKAGSLSQLLQNSHDYKTLLQEHSSKTLKDQNITIFWRGPVV